MFDCCSGTRIPQIAASLVIAAGAAIASLGDIVPAIAQQTQPSAAGTSQPLIDRTPTSYKVETWAAAKCGLRKDPIEDKYRDHELVGVYAGDWDGGSPANFIIYRVKGDGSKMGDIRLYYANAPYNWGTRTSNGGCWKEHKARIASDGAIELDVPKNGSRIWGVIRSGIFTASYKGKWSELSGTFVKQ